MTKDKKYILILKYHGFFEDNNDKIEFFKYKKDLLAYVKKESEEGWIREPVEEDDNCFTVFFAGKVLSLIIEDFKTNQ